MKCLPLLATALWVPPLHPAAAETIEVSIGHQSMCTDTYTAGIVIKEMKLLEKHLPQDGKYKDATYEITWSDYASGGPITNQMLASKLNIGVMGDYPLIVNGAKFQETNSLRTLYVAGTGYNLKGSGNAIVVPVDVELLHARGPEGQIGFDAGRQRRPGACCSRRCRTPISRSTRIELKNQAPAVGAANIAAGKIDAHADFCPWSEIMEFRGTGRKIYDGTRPASPICTASSCARTLPRNIRRSSSRSSRRSTRPATGSRQTRCGPPSMMEKWTGVEKEVLYLYFSKGGHLTLDPTIKPAWVDALKLDHGVLAQEKLIPVARLRQLDHRELRQARLQGAGRRLRGREGQDRRSW